MPESSEITGAKYQYRLKAIASVDSIAKVGDEESVAKLVDMLNDKSWVVRKYVSETLGKMGRIAVPHLLEALTNGVWYVRANSANALGSIGDPIALEPLSRFFDDDNETVKQSATDAFKKIFVNASVEDIANMMTKLEDNWQVYLLDLFQKINKDKKLEIENALKKINPKDDNEDKMSVVADLKHATTVQKKEKDDKKLKLHSQSESNRVLSDIKSDSLDDDNAISDSSKKSKKGKLIGVLNKIVNFFIKTNQ